MTHNENYWWAEKDSDALEGYPWCPTLQTDNSCFSLPVWFAIEEECETFIKEEILGAGYASQD